MSETPLDADTCWRWAATAGVRESVRAWGSEALIPEVNVNEVATTMTTLPIDEVRQDEQALATALPAPQVTRSAHGRKLEGR